MRITREFLIELGFTIVIKEDKYGRIHWFVADNKVFNMRVFINLEHHSFCGLSYLTLERLSNKARVYRGNVDQDFLKKLIEFNEK